VKGKKIRIGGGAGFETDIFEPAVILAQKGDIQYLCFETLAERTLAFAQKRVQEDPTKGYNPLTEARIKAVLPSCLKKGIRIISNFGAANPSGATDVVIKAIQDMGMDGLKIATVLGDDVRHLLKPNLKILETDKTLDELEEPYLRYLGEIEEQVSQYLSPRMASLKVRRLACAVAGFVFGFFSFAMIGMTSDEIETSIKPLRRVFVRSLCAFLGR